MSADTTPSDQQTTVGVDAVSLERYSAVQTDNLQLIVYDELIEDAWIQSDDWTNALLMA